MRITINYSKYEPPGGSIKNVENLKIYENQNFTAKNIFDSFFLNNVLMIHLIGEPQQGKTGVISRFIELLIINYKYTKIISDNIFIITGDNNLQWKEQTIKRIPELLKENVFIGNKSNFNKMEKLINNKKNIIFIIDESHIASNNSNMLVSILSKNKFNDFEYMLENNIKILTLSATDPRHCLIIERLNKINNWTKIICLQKDSSYVSLKKLLDMENLRDLDEIYEKKINKKIYNHELISKIILTKYKNFKYHVIRFPVKNYNNYLREFKNNYKSFDIVEWNCKTTSKDINSILKNRPNNHTWIIIKNMFRNSKTLIKSNIGIMIDRFSKQDDVVVQSLAGRCCGYEYFSDIIIYTNINSINNYILLLENILKTSSKKFSSKTLTYIKGYLSPKENFEYYSDIYPLIFNESKNIKSIILWKINFKYSKYYDLDINNQEFPSNHENLCKIGNVNNIILCLSNLGFLGLWKIIKPTYKSKSNELKAYNEKYKDIFEKSWRIRCKLIKNFDNPIIIKDKKLFNDLCAHRYPVYLKLYEINILKQENIITNDLF